MTDYRINIERFEEAYPDVEPLCRAHYDEMQMRLAGLGVFYPDYNPRLDAYVAADKIGELVFFVTRTIEGEAIGYSSVWITRDLHNSELVSQEDTIYIRRDHRNGIGRKLTKFILSYLQESGVKRAHVGTMTDPRVVKMCERLGFRHIAHGMTLSFEEHNYVL